MEQTVKLGLDTSKFDSGMNKVKSAFKVAAVGAAALAAAAGAALVVINRYADSIDELAKSSDKLGVATQSLQGLRYAAKMAGVENEQLQKTMRNMNQSLVQVAQGTGRAGGAIKALGLDFDDIRKLAPDKQFIEISRALADVDNVAQRTALAVDIFGNAGREAINLMSGDIQAQVDEWSKLGLGISRSQAAIVEQYNDSVAKLRTLWDGFFEQLTVAVAGPLTSIVDKITEIVVEMGGMDAVAHRFATAMVNAASWILDGLSWIIESVYDVQLAMNNIAGTTNRIGGNWAAFKAQFGLPGAKEAVAQAVEIEESLLAQNAQIRANSRTALSGIQQVQDALAASANVIGAGVGAADNNPPADPTPIVAATASVANNTAAAAAAQREYNQEIANATRLAETAANQAEQEEQRRQQLISGRFEQLRQGLLTETQRENEHYELKMQSLNDYYEMAGLADHEHMLMREQLEQQHQDRLFEIQKAQVDRSMQLFRDGEFQKIDFAQFSWDQQVEFTKQAGTMILGELAKNNKAAFRAQQALQISQAIMNTATGATKALAQGGIMGPIMAGLVVAAGAAQIGAITSQRYQGRFTGGSVMSGKPYVVGERGPEIFSPSQSGTIIPNQNTGGGKDVNITFEVSAIDASDFDSVLASRRGMIINMVRQAMNENPRAMR